MKGFKDNWLSYVIGMLALVIAVLMPSFGFKRDDDRELKKELDSKATFEYVDKQIKPVDEKINMHIATDDKRWGDLFKRMDDIVKTQNIILDNQLRKK